MKFPAYPKYKPSGVEWLGDVPQHWGVKRLKWVGESIIGLTYSPTDVVSEGEGTLVLRSSNIQGGRIVFDDNVFVSAEIPSKLRTRPNDIVICTRNGSRDLVGKTGKISEQDAGLTFGAFTAVFRSSSNAYMFYVFNSSLFSFQAGLYQTSTIFQLTNGTINAFQIPLPPSDEQHAIANFLDAQTARLDALLAKRRALIEKLSEKRTALISRTVTRGLNPKARLKPSGIEWLGDAPEHWKVLSLRYAFLNLDHRRIPVAGEERATIEKTYPYYGASGIIDYVDDYIFDETLILVAEDGANLLSRSTPLAFLASGKYWVNNHAHILKPLGGDIRYWVAVLHTFDYTPFVTGAAQPKLTSERLGSIKLPKPPLAEQIAIAEFLDRETAKLDQMMEKVQAAIGKLQEYRTALITAAVTGKIDVRKIKPCNPPGRALAAATGKIEAGREKT
jgi:type I restriction enzyme S subunit